MTFDFDSSLTPRELDEAMKADFFRDKHWGKLDCRRRQHR